jgi:iron complex outermembrane receptor protein
MAYASYDRGFKSGYYNISSAGGAAAAPLKPEFIDASEIGLKTEFFDRRLLLDVDGFYYTITDLQVKFVSPALGLPVTANAASARDMGFDATLEAELTSQLLLTANATYADYTYTSYNNVTFFNYSSTSGNPGNLGVQGKSFLGSADGHEVIFAEPWSENVGLRYHTDTSVGEIIANTNVSFHSRAYFDAQNVQRRDAYQLVNATIGWKSLDRSLGVDVWGRNLANEKYYVNFNYAGYSGDYSPGEPLTFGVTVRYHF